MGKSEQDHDIRLRPAMLADVPALQVLEQRCFSSDKLSVRSFRRFITEKRSDLIALEVDEALAGYFLLIYRRGTSLARLYSIAVDPAFRQKGLAEKLMAEAEVQAANRHCALLRLEVRKDNEAAIKLYKKLQYHEFAIKHDFYEDHADAICMQKQVIQFKRDSVTRQVPYIAQTTPFTCGPASLLMAFNYFKPGLFNPYQHEIELWREATTIFMTSGHGGCGPRGLALAAHRRGFSTEVYLNNDGLLFGDSVRSEAKKAVLQRVHDSFRQQTEQQGVTVHHAELTVTAIKQYLQQDKLIIALISTWQFDKSKAPHWVVVCAADDNFIYINDPDTADIPWLSTAERQYIPIEYKVFSKAFSYGKKRLKAAVIIGAQKK
ncbi:MULTISPECIES: GNAT family N-acetyltransferase/peptidase C39 family protein [unclassified Arsukibacterium]|uniref:GNAT family N-acetyltransferase/peptidase C39 family protein n=1 Tax=unclassified Arsukibacterium TaxID=2635278 RepID=UPI000C5D20EA|nr:MULTISPECIES: GNAT family N-acetyltransferase/peptidase C39 family protein [unclassified Arsukibacterium]MAA95085.1 ribosomal-protein-alanine acetyltransferase [Rheinheimera sp.]MBM34638.1 ribosomal-protein-alanine acetyltransferase [Rheinheimera sp.]HAW94358.1 ribosomal-protein-alanine acetyltransferase [Candidatus Azambacteria bacterium]|tara:strand:+ start:549203 stop:550333 length:1131 start_codon:yes stop_codon:yes gene_type:complete